jgi:hypothetical protein
LYVSGGLGFGGNVRDVVKLVGKEWVHVQYFPDTIKHVLGNIMVAVDEYIYLLTATGQMSRLDTLTNEWQYESHRRCSNHSKFMVYVVRDQIYVFCSNFGTIQKYCTLAREWSDVAISAPLPADTEFIRVMDDQVYFIGPDVHRLDPETNLSTRIKSLGANFQVTRSFVLDGELHILDGREHHSYDASQDTWKLRPEPNPQLDAHQVATITNTAKEQDIFQSLIDDFFTRKNEEFIE